MIRNELNSVSNSLPAMKYLLFIIIAFIVLTGCKRKKPSLSGDEPVQVEDFIESFTLTKPPFEIADTMLNKKEKDSLFISYVIFTQFVPDTVLTKVFGKNAKPKIYPLKRVEVDNQETYLFAKAVLGEKKVGYILGFDKKKQFAGFMELLRLDDNPSTQQVSGLDRKLSVYKIVFHKRPDGATDEGKEVYVFNPEAGQFTLIMTDALDDKLKEIVNPIDTFQAKNKYSADYVKDKMNIVSIRDGNRPGKINIFIHFEKNEGTCSGEIKGEAGFTSANTAVYQHAGDPCVLQLHFSSSSVTLKELRACGNRRGVKCSFDGTYPRKKIVKPKPPKKKR